MTTDFGVYAPAPFLMPLLKSAQSMPVNWAGRRLALILRKIFLILGRSPVDAEVGGVRMRFHTDDNVSERKFLFMPQFYDVEERRFIRDTLGPGRVFVDIGANAGIYTLAAALTGAQVLSVEPNPKALERLRLNIALNGFEERVTVEAVGIAEKAGAFMMELDATNLGGGSLVPGWSASGAEIEVPCLALLDVLRRNAIAGVDILKIDIEGAEDRALVPFLRDAPPTLLPRIMIMEGSDNWALDLKSACIKAGYTLSRKTRMNFIWTR